MGVACEEGRQGPRPRLLQLLHALAFSLAVPGKPRTLPDPAQRPPVRKMFSVAMLRTLFSVYRVSPAEGLAPSTVKWSEPLCAPALGHIGGHGEWAMARPVSTSSDRSVFQATPLPS